MFDGDTKLFYKHRNLITLYNIVNNELIKISKWFKLNKLSLYIIKTNYIIFHNNGKTVNNVNLVLKIYKCNN